MKLKEYLHEQNVKPSDVGKVLITFKIAAYLTWVLFVPICGKLKPIRRIGRMAGPKKLKRAFMRRYPNKYEQWEEHIIKGSEWFAKRNYVRWIPDAFGQRHKDFGLAIAEATVLYKLLFPLWAPFEFMYIVRLYKKKWGMSDIIPTPKSVEEYTDSYRQASGVNIYSFNEEQEAEPETANDDDDDDSNKGNNGTGSGSNRAGRSAGNEGSSDRRKSISRMSLYGYSSSMSHLMTNFTSHLHIREQLLADMEWGQFLSRFRQDLDFQLTV